MGGFAGEGNIGIPINSEEVTSLKNKVIPPLVIDTFNNLILARLDTSGRAVVKQSEVVGILVNHGMDRQAIFDNRWLDVEDSFRRAGWKVEYDKPGFNESYDATFTFERKKKRR